jgi:hypothetical protein
MTEILEATTLIIWDIAAFAPLFIIAYRLEKVDSLFFFHGIICAICGLLIEFGRMYVAQIINGLFSSVTDPGMFVVFLINLRVLGIPIFVVLGFLIGALGDWMIVSIKLNWSDSWRISKEVPWSKVYDCVCLLHASFKETLGDDLTIVCTKCDRVFGASWVENAGMKSSLDGFIAFSSREISDSDRLKMKLAAHKPEEWTCPQCGSTNTVFIWTGISPFGRRRFNRACKLGRQG